MADQNGVIVAGQPLEVGDEACMLFTFADLERQKKAEDSLRQSEERFEKSFRSSPSATILLRATDFTFVAVNEAFVKNIRPHRDGSHRPRNGRDRSLG